MSITKEQVGLAVQSGLELLGPESEVAIPAKLNDGVFLLKQLLAGIAQGKIALAPGEPSTEPPTGDETPNRKTRRKTAAKKRSKKKS